MHQSRSTRKAPRIAFAAVGIAVAGILCAAPAMGLHAVAEQPAHAHKVHRAAAVSARRLTTEQRTSHALNRLTFGPRPGEAARVEAMGLEAWFQQQLHPDQMADTALEARLARYPAMKLPQIVLVERFPTPEMLRRYSRGGLAAPDDTVEAAIYADAAFEYEERVANRTANLVQVAGSATMPAAMPAAFSATGPLRGNNATAPAPIERRLPGGASLLGSDMGTNLSGTQSAPMTPAAMEALLKLPPEARMQRLVALPPDEMQGLQVALKGPEQERLYAGMTAEQAELVAAMKSPERLIDSEVLSTRLLRDVYSQRELQAVMTDFWLNHFSVYLRKNQNETYLLPAYEREAVLPHALGKFEDLLVATAQSPAMLVYLDNWESVGPDSRAAQRAAAADRNRPEAALGKTGAKRPQGINENYARELMELHTLGVNGGYTQADVVEVAKCFTGWTIDRPANGGEFLFNPNRHEPGTKVVLGHTIPEGGVNEGLAVLHLLATSPATAHFVSLKLAQRFVSDTPPAALVNRMAATFLRTDGDIAAVLTTMFHAPEFWSPDVYRAKVKTPLEFVASALRASDADVVNPVPLVQAMDRLGMPIYGMQTPNGYSWEADAWVSSNALLTRMNFALVLSGNRLRGTRLQWPTLLGPAGDAAAIPDALTEQRLEMVLLGEPASPKTRQAVLTGGSAPGVQQQAEQSFREVPLRSAKLAMQPVSSPAPMLRVKAGRAPVVTGAETSLGTTAGLLLGSPDFQRR